MECRNTSPINQTELVINIAHSLRCTVGLDVALIVCEQQTLVSDDKLIHQILLTTADDMFLGQPDVSLILRVYDEVISLAVHVIVLVLIVIDVHGDVVAYLLDDVLQHLHVLLLIFQIELHILGFGGAILPDGDDVIVAVLDLLVPQGVQCVDYGLRLLLGLEPVLVEH